MSHSPAEKNLLHIYSDDYSDSYDERFLTNEYIRAITEYKIDILKELFETHQSWLDVACGTGYFLSRFQGFNRGGADLSPAMLRKAASKNPDVTFFKEVNFKHDYPEMANQWEVVSCMWGAYCYAESLQEARTILLNLVKWIKDGGTLFLPVLELADIRPDSPVSYIEPVEAYGGITKVTSCTWSWIEAETGLEHELMSVCLDYLHEIIGPYFDTIEIRQYRPHESKNPEKIIVARGKKSSPSATLAPLQWCEVKGVQLPPVIQQAAPAPKHVPAPSLVRRGLRFIKRQLGL
jgi:SAM-dependent methyltransferase